MKTITGILACYALIVPAAPAAAQGGDLHYQIERIVDSALAIAADALGDLADARDRQGRGDRAREDRGPEYKDTFSKTVRLGRNGRLELDNLSGDVEVTGVGGDDVKITATKITHSASESTARAALAATQIDVNERPGVVTISSQPTRGRFNGVEVNYVITVPAGTALTLKTVSGDMTLKSVSGDVRLRALSGDLVLRDAKPTDVEIESVSGDITLEQVETDRMQVNSISGDIVFKGSLSKNGRYELKTNSGDIQVVTDKNASFDVEAGTFSGDVTCDFAMKLRGAASSFAPGPKGPRRNDIRGTVNDGGAQLSLHAFSGDIQITKR